MNELMFEERAKEISEYLLQDIALVKERMRAGTKLIKEAWEKTNPKTDEAIFNFYKTTDAYIYELTANECDPGKISQIEEMLRLIDQYKPRSILVYGVGVGSEALPIIERHPNISLAVADVPSLHYKFFMYRCIKHKMAKIMPFLVKSNTYGSEIPAKFDMIICFDVLEHVADAEALAKQLYEHLDDMGILLAVYMFNKDSGKLPEKLNTHPLHITHNKQGVLLRGGHFKAYLKQLGFKCDWNKYGSMWIKELMKCEK